MKNKFQALTFLATLAVVIGMISWGGTLSAQTTPSTPQDQQTPSTQPPATPDTPPTQQPSTQPSPSTPEPPAAQSPSSPTTQAPSTQAPSTQTPDQSSPTAGASATAGAKDSQVFSGTVEKQGDKYVLKDDAGKTYDIDHQTDVAKFDGKRVRVQGTLDETGKKILVK